MQECETASAYHAFHLEFIFTNDVTSDEASSLIFFVRQAVAIFQPCTGMVEILSYLGLYLRYGV